MYISVNSFIFDLQNVDIINIDWYFLFLFEIFQVTIMYFESKELPYKAAIIEQLKKIDLMIEQRRENAAYFRNKVAQFKNIRIQKEVGESSWFGFSIVLEGELRGKRDYIVESLRRADIECRPIVAGNFTRNRVIDYFDYSDNF